MKNNNVLFLKRDMPVMIVGKFDLWLKRGTCTPVETYLLIMKWKQLLYKIKLSSSHNLNKV